MLYLCTCIFVFALLTHDRTHWFLSARTFQSRSEVHAISGSCLREVPAASILGHHISLGSNILDHYQSQQTKLTTSKIVLFLAALVNFLHPPRNTSKPNTWQFQQTFHNLPSILDTGTGSTLTFRLKDYPHFLFPTIGQVNIIDCEFGSL